MTTEELIRLDTERLSALSSERLADIMGNPDLSAYKDKAETTDFSDFFLHPWTTKAILDPLITDLPSINILELGSGNGANGRTLCRLIDPKPTQHIHLVHLDLYDKNIEEAISRNKEFTKANNNFTYQGIQADLRSPTTQKQLIILLHNQFNIIFSIKFLHNTPLKVSRKLAEFLSVICSKQGIFVLQCYGDCGWTIEAKYAVKRLLGKGYSNSGFLDRLIARRLLKAVGFRLIYRSGYRGNLNQSYDHFQMKRYDYYFQKQ